MNRFAPIIVAALLGVADAPNDDAKAVQQLLCSLNDAYVKKDVEAMKRLMADDHLAIPASGQRQTKEEHLKSVSDLHITEYTMDDVRVVMPTKETAIITYQSTVKGKFKDKPLPPRITVSSVWANRNGKWQEVLYQETIAEKK